MSGMEFGAPKKENTEKTSNIKVEHLPDFDVVLNLDHKETEDFKIILDFLKNKEPADELSFLENTFKDLDKKFFVKEKPKTTAQRNVDFTLGRSNDDPLEPSIVRDFDKDARYAHSSILNEITLSPVIKKLVAGNAFQKLAQKYGFTSMNFVEPVAGVVKKYSKYLLYRNIKSINTDEYFWERFKMARLASNLRKLFIENGIVPHDLRGQQFLVEEKDGKRFLYLIDIEAYTKTK